MHTIGSRKNCDTSDWDAYAPQRNAIGGASTLGSVCRISDIELPGMDGWSLQTLVLVRRPEIPIIFITANAEIDELRKKRCLSRVPLVIFKKPFDGKQLLGAVVAALLSTNRRA